MGRHAWRVFRPCALLLVAVLLCGCGLDLTPYLDLPQPAEEPKPSVRVQSHGVGITLDYPNDWVMAGSDEPNVLKKFIAPRILARKNDPSSAITTSMTLSIYPKDIDEFDVSKTLLRDLFFGEKDNFLSRHARLMFDWRKDSEVKSFDVTFGKLNGEPCVIFSYLYKSPMSNSYAKYLNFAFYCNKACICISFECISPKGDYRLLQKVFRDSENTFYQIAKSVRATNREQ